MNAKYLFAATVAVSALSLASSLATAAGDTGPLTRAEVRAEAVHGGNAPRGELYGDQGVAPAVSATRRADVIAALAADRIVDRYDNIGERSGQATVSSYATSTLARAEVKADVRHAMADGSLLRNGENDSSRVADSASLSRVVRQHLALASK